MPLIECTHGPAETPVGGHVYNFQRDRGGRYVAEVHDLTHIMCLLSVVHYREVEPLADVIKEVTPQKPAKTTKPKKAETVVQGGFGLLGAGVQSAAENLGTEVATEQKDASEEIEETETDVSEESSSEETEEQTDGADEGSGTEEASDQGESDQHEGDQGETGTEEPAEEPVVPIVLPTAPKTNQQIRRRGKRR